MYIENYQYIFTLMGSALEIHHR